MPDKASQQPRARKRAACPAIPFPDLPATEGASDLFWRAAWLRATAEIAAIERLQKAQYRLKRPSRVTQYALLSAKRVLGNDAAACLKCLIDAGGLLYAWIPEGGAA